MKRGPLLLLAFFVYLHAHAQCLTSSLVINTGYNPLTGLAVTPGVDGGTPVPDPKWIVTYESPGIATALISTGLIEVVPGSPADVIGTVGGWVTNPPGQPGAWITCLNSTTYTTDGTGPTGTPYNMVLTRPFRMCSDDTIRVDLYIANDNYISVIDVDGIPTAFSQPPIADPANFSGFSHYTQNFPLAAGTHTINVRVHNYNETSSISNPMGMNIYGTVSSAGSINTLVSESYLACASYVCSTPCNAISLVDSLHPCIGDVITLPATIVGTDSILGITWSPATGLSSTTILAPTLTVTTSGYYNIAVQSIKPFNLVGNGDFSSGNTGFTSSYTYAAGPSTVLFEGFYSVYNNPFSVHSGFTSMGDHTTGTGQMMIINGGPTPTDVWCQTIPVTPNTDYDFSAWIANCSSITVGPDVPILQFKINGVLIGVPTSITTPPGTWMNFFSVWNSGTSTTATICIYDLNTTPAGNDFAIDDISFREICVAKDSVYIDVAIPDTTTTRRDTTLCAALGTITLNAATGYTSYLWNTGATTTSITAGASGTYWVRNINGCSIRIDTFNVTYIPVPVVSLGNDTAFCIGESLTLTSIQPAGTTYLWSTGATGNSIVVSTTGTYWLRVDNGWCVTTDTINILTSPHPVVDLGPDTFNCTATPITLQSSVPYPTGTTYLWNTGSTASTIIASTPGTYWLQVTVAGCASIDSVNVVIIYDTFTLYNNDTAICRGKQVPVFLNANPLASFQWLPTAGIANPNIRQPIISPDTSAMYRVIISYAGCPDLIDSFYIDVQPRPVLYAGNNRQVCQYDTVRLQAAVWPNWYTKYTYSWSPTTWLDDPTKSTVIYTAGAPTKYIVSVTTPANCSDTDSVNVIVFPGDFAKLDTNYQVCPHDTVQLMPTGGVSYQWHPGRYLDDSTAATPWARAVTSIVYTAIATSADGCLDTVSTSITVHPAGQIHLGDSVKLYPGESYHITPQTNCTRFAWFPAAGLNNAYISDPVATPEFNMRYVVHAKTDWGCEVRDSISIYYDPESLLAIPNAFTPGGEINNTLKLIKRGQATLNYFRIFNRWGNLVFETQNIDEGWDGTYKGKPQPFGVYVYQVEAVTSIGHVFHRHGNVTLVR